MLIIVEGPDMGGKTTLVNFLTSEVFPQSYFVSMLGGRTQPHNICRKRVYDTVYTADANPDKTFICERFHAISDRVYRSLDGDPHIFNGAERDSLYKRLSNWRSTRIVYCRPPLSEINIFDHEMKGDDDPAWVETINKNVVRVFRAYDFEMFSLARRGGAVLHYNFTDSWASELLLKGLRTCAD